MPRQSTRQSQRRSVRLRRGWRGRFRGTRLPIRPAAALRALIIMFHPTSLPPEVAEILISSPRYARERGSPARLPFLPKAKRNIYRQPMQVDWAKYAGISENLTTTDRNLAIPPPTDSSYLRNRASGLSCPNFRVPHKGRPDTCRASQVTPRQTCPAKCGANRLKPKDLSQTRR